MVDRYGTPRPLPGIASVLCVAALMVLAGLIAGCGPSATATPESCDGVAAEMGGCDPDQPTFAGTTCAEVGAEWGEIVDERVLAVIDGPATANGSHKSVRLKDAQVLAYVRAVQHMQEIGILDSCHSAEFIGAAEPKFSPELRSSVGGAMYDGEPVVTYTEFLADVVRTVGGLDGP